MTEEQRNIKTVPIYYENDIVGSAEITTVKCASAKDAARYFDAWSIKNIKINNCFKFMFLHLYKDHKIYLNTILGRTVYEGKAVTVGLPNYELVVDRDNMRYPFRPELNEIGFI